MIRLIVLISLLSSVPSLAFNQKQAEKYTKQIEKHVRTMRDIADRTDKAVSTILYIAEHNLRIRGFEYEADEIGEGRIQFEGFLVQSYLSRDIGSFAPMSKFLDRVETMVEQKLGYKLTYALRITDLKTINYSIPVVFFSACKVGMYEYMAHFCGDIHVNPKSQHPYRGLFPTTSYWTMLVSCSLSTAGLLSFACSPVAAIGEWAIDGGFSPWLAPRLYQTFCGREE